MKPRSPLQRYLPGVYMGMSLLLVAVLLPTALRPPQPPPPSSAEFSPDAPPDENSEVLLSELSRGSSSTAGAGNVVGAEQGEGVKVGTKLEPSRVPCIGEPPRQLESVYSPPCVPAWKGTDNGGATHRGVTKNEIRIGFMMSLVGNGDDGEIPDRPVEGESAVTRTYRVLRDYFNKNLELYGRKLRFFYVEAQDDENGNSRSAALRAAEEYKVFGAINETSVGVFDELVRRGVVTFTLGQVNQKFLSDPNRRPFAWSATPDSTGLIHLGAEYLCKKLHGKPPVYTNDPSFDYGKPRTFGILSYQEGVGYEENVPLMKRLIKEQCGANVEDSVEFGFDVDDTSGGDSTAPMTTAIARMKAAGVTTIISLHDFVSNTVITQAADEAKYFPEWYLPGFGGLDVVDVFFQLYSPTQWQHAFGFTVYEIPARPQDHECVRAYHTIDPNTDPDYGMCYYMWQQMVQLFGAMQLAGPKLDPVAMERAMYLRGRNPPNPLWRMAGGYGPGDWTYPDFAAEIWFSPTTRHVNGRLGAYHYIRGGKRYERGEFPAGDSPMFQDRGITEAPRGGAGSG